MFQSPQETDSMKSEWWVLAVANCVSLDQVIDNKNVQLIKLICWFIFCSFFDYVTVIYFLFILFFSFLFQIVSIQLTLEIGIYVIVFLIQVFNVYYYLLIQSKYIIWKYIDLFCYKNCQLFISTLYLVLLGH